jgi:putative MFS transporter
VPGRGTTGWTYALSRMTTGLMPFLLLPLLEARGPGSVFLVVATAMLIVAADIALLGPRTSARSLEEINPRQRSGRGGGCVC